MTVKKTGTAAALLFALNLLAGAVFINEGIFHYDGIVLAKAVESTYACGSLQPAVRGRYGAVLVNSVLYAPFFAAGRSAEFITRFSSVLFHALSIALLFLFVYEFWGSFIQGFFSALLFSFTPVYFTPNTYGKEHGMSMFFLLLSLYLLCRGLRANSPRITAVSALALVFAISVRESALVAVPLYALVYLGPEVSLRPFRVRVPPERLRAKSFLPVLLPFLAVFAFICFAYFGREFYAEILGGGRGSVEFLGLFSRILPAAFKDLRTGIPLLLFLFSLVGIWRMFRGKNVFTPFLLAAWFLLIFYFGNLAEYSPRFLDIVFIPVCIAAAYALAGLHARERVSAWLVAVYCAASMFAFMYPMLAFRHRYNGEKQFALYVNGNTEPNAVIIAMDDALFIEYYGKRRTMPHPLKDRAEMTAFLRAIAVSLINKVPVYLITSGMGYDKDLVFQSILLTNFDLTVVGSKLYEDYHRPELAFAKYNQTLYRLDFKFKGAGERGEPVPSAPVPGAQR